MVPNDSDSGQGSSSSRCSRSDANIQHENVDSNDAAVAVIRLSKEESKREILRELPIIAFENPDIADGQIEVWEQAQEVSREGLQM